MFNSLTLDGKNQSNLKIRRNLHHQELLPDMMMVMGVFELNETINHFFSISFLRRTSV